MMAQNDPYPADWIGRSEQASDIVSPRHVAGLRLLLDHDDTASATNLPQCGHWTLAPAMARAADTGPDGHIMLGRFLPPLPLPRRMWAASQIAFHAPIHSGMTITRSSVVKSVRNKTGSTGALVFIEVEHRYSSSADPLVTEVQTLVYRAVGAAGRAPAAEAGADTDWPLRRRVVLDAVALFRYSALTFNSHRIHYDQPYATVVEGYAGLVVHGPLLATLLADLVARNLGPNRLRTFAFRAQNPAFADEALDLAGHVQGGLVGLIARGADGRVLMTAEGML